MCDHHTSSLVSYSILLEFPPTIVFDKRVAFP